MEYVYVCILRVCVGNVFDCAQWNNNVFVCMCMCVYGVVFAYGISPCACTCVYLESSVFLMVVALFFLHSKLSVE
jgi:hypothetical protein